MIELRLDGMRAVPKDNQTIKLTSENPLFTKSATYTYDVELPLGIAENQRIFGFINRIDVSKQQRKMGAVLIVDNIKVLTGTAHITSVSDSAVKVQLLGNASAYNYYAKSNDLYIDELDLGDWYTTTWPDRSWYKKKNADGSYSWVYWPENAKHTGIATHMVARSNQSPTGEDPSYSARLALHLGNGSYPWVAFPTINSAAGVVCNAHNYHIQLIENPEYKLLPYWDVQVGDLRHELPTYAVAIQPFVWIMAKKIAQATGFELTDTNNALYTNQFLNKIFIVHGSNRIECNKCLPHWSVSEWWEQIENTFGLHLSIDSDSKNMILSERSDYYNIHSNDHVLTDIIDDSTSEFDDDTQVDISSNNVGFADFEADPADLLDDFIIDNCTVNNDFNSITDLLAWGQRQTNLAAAYKGTLFNCKDGRQFIFTEANGFVEVNQFRPRIVDTSKDDIDIELKFVPARFADGDCTVYDVPKFVMDSHGGHTETRTQSFDVKMLQWPGGPDLQRLSEDNSLDIEKVIDDTDNSESDSNDMPDVIYMARLSELTTGGDWYDVNMTLESGLPFNHRLWFPRPKLRAKIKAALDGTITTEDPDYSLSLVSVDGVYNLASHITGNAGMISAKVRHCIKFISNSIPDPADIFLIHNRRFVCEKIEADIQSTGLNKLMTGYFYETDL